MFFVFDSATSLSGQEGRVFLTDCVAVANFPVVRSLIVVEAFACVCEVLFSCGDSCVLIDFYLGLCIVVRRERAGLLSCSSS